MRLGGGAITTLIEKLSEFFVAECEGVLVLGKSAFGKIQRRFGNSDCLRQAIACAQVVELVVED